MAIIKPTLNLVASEYTPDILNVTRASSATRVNAAGLVELVGAGTLRYDYDPTTFAGKGWLIEEARTNLCLQSEDFGTTWAVITTVNITTNTTTAPDGNTTADTMTLNNTTDHPVFQNSTIVNDSNDVTNSIFVKQPASGGLTEVRLQIHMFGGTAKDGYCNYVFATGVASVVGQVDSVTVTEFPDGWFRITATMANNSTGNTGCRLSIYRGGTSETGDVYIWGGQMEAGSFPTSYIPTTTAAVTRAVDAVTCDISDFNFSQDSMTLYAHGAIDAVQSTWQMLAATDDGTNTHKTMVGHKLNITTILGYSTGGGAAELPAAEGGVNGAYNRMAYSVTDADGAFCVDAGTVSTNVNSMPTGDQTILRIGTEVAGGRILRGHIKHVAVWTVAMSNADLQTITTG
jgi:hypothetical protein